MQGFDKHGRRVLILRGAKVDPDKFTMIDQFRANLMVNELLMKECDDEQGNFFKCSIKQLLIDYNYIQFRPYQWCGNHSRHRRRDR